ncbi:nuclear transport factor 2 family protein [Dietzia sp. CH92]|uniref:nuclear transport factor 2 family protein n=1 Tax=Dietzia sp. CH92 TaxID=3051823 RepID=UPI0028D8F030|nr:nuclear transport factor 2 family protein [Dietzia sp. CH92]
MRDYTDALNKWDIETMHDLSTEDIVFELPFRPPTFERETVGRAAYMEVLGQARDHMIEGSENLHDMSMDTLANDPNVVIATYKSDMTLRSGVRYANEYIARFVLRDGKVARFVEYYDSIILFRALGGSLVEADESELLPEGLKS